MTQIKYDEKIEDYLNSAAKEFLGKDFGKLNSVLQESEYRNFCELADELCRKKEGQRLSHLLDVFTFFEKRGVIDNKEKLKIAAGFFSAVNQYITEEMSPFT